MPSEVPQLGDTHPEPAVPQLGDTHPVCTNCRARPSMPHRRKCLICAQKQQDEYWQAVEEGRCTICRTHHALEGNRRCAECRDKMRRYFVDTYARAKAQGKCTYCRKHRRMPHRLLCFDCFQKNAELHRLARERKYAAWLAWAVCVTLWWGGREDVRKLSQV